MASVRIRQATLDDFGAIDALVQPVHDDHVAAHPEQFRLTASAFPIERLTDLLAVGSSCLLVAEVGGDIVGFLAATVREAPPFPAFVQRQTVYVEMVAVSESIRGRGIGSYMMQRTIDWARSQGIGELELNVFDFNDRAIRFYERLGMKSKSRRMSLPLWRYSVSLSSSDSRKIGPWSARFCGPPRLLVGLVFVWATSCIVLAWSSAATGICQRTAVDNSNFWSDF